MGKLGRWRNARYQTKLLILFFLLSSIPAFIIGAIGSTKSSGTLEAQTTQDLKVILAQFNASIERQISDFDRFSMLPYFMPEVFSFLNKPALSPEQWGTEEINAQKTMARLMSAYPSINSSIKGLMVYGMNGSINGYRLDGDSTINGNYDAKDEDWYQEVMAGKGHFTVTGIQNIQQFKTNSFDAIIGARLLMDEDYKPLAVTTMFISPRFISNLVDSLELPNAQVIVVDRDGNLIYASNAALAAELQKHASQNVPHDEWEFAIKEQAGSKTFSGVSLKSDYLEWQIYMGVDKDAILQSSRSIQSFTIVIIICVAVLAAVASLLIARGFSQPISRLIRSMRKVEKGQFFTPEAHGRADEIGQLESSYGRMVIRLQELIQSIEEKERQKRHAELYALRARIQPHFLYNTLNSIRMLAVLQQSGQIAKLIQSLNKLLHANMKLDSELVTFEEEIRLLRDYATLMDLRYTNVFDMEWHIPPELNQASIPPMLLQPLLENAIFHGAKGLERKLHITLEARLEGKDNRLLVIELRDDGSGFNQQALELLKWPQSDTGTQNIGLRNVQDRIRLRFGEEYGLSFERSAAHTIVTVRMPYRILEKEENADVESARR
ncbi:cache domain-containing sensor histidine kinase [Paenibacillus algorifonticola]|uniref:cache domain-containing sensor histidine kinase n=1 Tax=Paenibacillus algorifonticola TaxID=684063 RepID=UPI003D2C4C91